MRLSDVAVVLGNLVLQNQVVAKRVPRHFRYQAMVLMRIPTIVSENDVGRDRLQLLKHPLDVDACERHESVIKRLQQRALQLPFAREEFSRALRLGLADSRGAKHDPVKLAVWVLFGQAQDCAAASN